VAVNTTEVLSALHGKTVVAISAGYQHNLALCSDVTVAAWGWNISGQVGDNTSQTNRIVPVAVNAAPGVSALYGKTVVSVSAGERHSLALCSDGSVAAWGGNGGGALGNNSTIQHNAPVAVNRASGISALHGKTVVSIAAGAGHSLALCSDGSVAAWGDNFDGALGDNTTSRRLVPVAVSAAPAVSALYGKSVVTIAAGYGHSLAMCSDGTVAAWGYNSYGELGDKTTSNRLVPVEASTNPLAASQRFARVVSGSYAAHTLALVAAPPALPIILSELQTMSRGSFRFIFTGTPGGSFGVLTATNPALPLDNWTLLTGLTEVLPGQFQFSDPDATNSPRRFYRIRSP
jgi:alpha-tubulin suppressor-like RCC1 family protein